MITNGEQCMGFIIFPINSLWVIYVNPVPCVKLYGEGSFMGLSTPLLFEAF